MECKHFVIIRFSALGDVALITGVLHYLHIHYGYTFSVITKKSLVPLFQENTAVTAVHAFSDNFSLFYLLKQAKSLAKEYRNSPLIDLHGTLRTKIFALFWNAPVHVYPRYSKERRQFLRTKNQKIGKMLKETSVTQRYFLAFSSYTKTTNPLPTKEELSPNIMLTEEEEQATKKKYSLPKKYIVIHPYAMHATKMWPEIYWQDLTTLLHSKGYTVLVVGRSVKVFSFPEIILEHNFTNRTTLRESLVILKNASVSITADSAILHLSAAVQTPCVTLFGPTTQEWGFFPPEPSVVLEDKTLLCRPCSLHGEEKCPFASECMYNIEPKVVVYTIEVLLEKLI